MKSKILTGLIVACLIVAWAAFQHHRDQALLDRADCAVAMGGELTEETFAAATRHACAEAGILKP